MSAMKSLKLPTSSVLKKGLKLALLAQAKAYAPYSQFRVGAAALFKGSDLISSGFNIENSSYGATVCAERVAIFSHLAKIKTKSEKPLSLKHLWLVTQGEHVPCGLCLQVLSEFSQDDTTISLATPERGIYKNVSLQELIPFRFAGEFLKKS